MLTKRQWRRYRGKIIAIQRTRCPAIVRLRNMPFTHTVMSQLVEAFLPSRFCWGLQMTPCSVYEVSFNWKPTYGEDFREVFADHLAWCKSETAPASWIITTTADGRIVFEFKDENDAILFKLMFGSQKL